jgi:hypothetical protein
MNIERLNFRNTAYFTLVVVSMIGYSMPAFRDANVWLSAFFVMTTLTISFFMMRFTLRYRQSAPLRFVILTGIKGFLQILVFVGWIGFFVWSWLVKFSIVDNSLYLNATVVVWAMIGLLVAFWLFKESKRI